MLSDVEESRALGYYPAYFVVIAQDLGARATGREGWENTRVPQKAPQ